MRPEFDLPAYDGIELDGRRRRDHRRRGRRRAREPPQRFGTLITVDRPATDGRLRPDRPHRHDRRRRGRHRQGHLVRGRLGRPDRGHRRGARLADRRRDDHLRVQAARRRPRGRDRPDRRHRHRRQGARAARGRRRLRPDRQPVRHHRRAKGDLKEQLAKSKTFGQGAAGARPGRREAPRARRDPRPREARRRRGAPSPRAGEPPRRRRAPRRGQRVAARRPSATRSSSTRSPRRKRSRSSQDELTQYLIQGAAQYGMEPGEFIKVLDQNGQIPAMVGEVARSKALAVVLSQGQGRRHEARARRRPVGLHRRRRRERRGRRRRPREARPTREADESLDDREGRPCADPPPRGRSAIDAGRRGSTSGPQMRPCAAPPAAELVRSGCRADRLMDTAVGEHPGPPALHPIEFDTKRQLNGSSTWPT